MTQVRLRLMRYPTDFRFRFAHAAASRKETENVICVAEADGVLGYGEGCPRSYVTGETMRSAIAFFETHRLSLENAAADLPGLYDWIYAHQSMIDANPAAFAAIELALLDLFGRRAGQTIESLLGLPTPPELTTSAVFGLASLPATFGMAAAYRLNGMTDAKVKVSANAPGDRRRIGLIGRILGRRSRVRVDANNLFTSPDACLAHLSKIDRPVWAIEEPLAQRDFAGMAEVASTARIAVILDESAVSISDLTGLIGPSWIVNLRVSKHGGLIRSLEVARRAKDQGLGVIIGAHVGETSILARASIALSAAAGESLLASECGYGGILLARDITRPPIGFGRGGRLGREFNEHGLGIIIDAARLASAPADVENRSALH